MHRIRNHKDQWWEPTRKLTCSVCLVCGEATCFTGETWQHRMLWDIEQSLEDQFATIAPEPRKRNSIAFGPGSPLPYLDDANRLFGV